MCLCAQFGIALHCISHRVCFTHSLCVRACGDDSPSSLSFPSFLVIHLPRLCASLFGTFRCFTSLSHSVRLPPSFTLRGGVLQLAHTHKARCLPLSSIEHHCRSDIVGRLVLVMCDLMAPRCVSCRRAGPGLAIEDAGHSSHIVCVCFYKS